jgi:putative iron-regulated protein
MMPVFNPQGYSPMMRMTLLASLSAFVLAAAAASALADEAAVAKTYADIAEAKYADSLAAAKTLDAAVEALVAQPNAETLAAARAAWLAARIPYQQTEAYRFGNPIVDEWEGRVNAWPLDEGLIDYVDASYGSESDENALFTANVIANPSISINGETVDATAITPAFLQQTLHEAGGIEANVATGYHAIEFLLWGQDLNGTAAGAGTRPASDFASGADCSNGNCDRRAAYLEAATDLLVADLEEILAAWQTGGAARASIEGDPKAAMTAIFTGMGSLSYGELAGERMKLGLLLHDPEEEHDCFSDNTHNSHLYDAVGIENVYLGRYVRTDGSVIEGASLSSLVAAKDPAIDAELKADLSASVSLMQIMAERAQSGEAYDQMIGEGNAEGNQVVQAAIDGLIKQTRTIERAIAALAIEGVSIEGSDSLDNTNAVFQ